MRIFRKLVRFMTEYDFTAESKDTIKDFIKEYNLKILRSSLKDYSADEKPSIEDLVETLSNHAFLDRKPNGNIGIVNDFIFGLLVGENLTKGKYQEYYSDFYNITRLSIILGAVGRVLGGGYISRKNQIRQWKNVLANFCNTMNKKPHSATFHLIKKEWDSKTEMPGKILSNSTYDITQEIKKVQINEYGFSF